MPSQKTATGQGAMNLSFNFVDAKLRGRRRKLYEGDRLENLVRKRSVREVAEALFPEDTPSGPQELQKRLDQGAVEDLAGFLTYLDETRGNLLRALLRRYQVWNLKIALRLLGHESASEEAPRLMLDLPASLALPRDELLASSDAEEFVDHIPDDTLRETAADALDLYKESRGAGYLEMALDRGWWRSLKSALDELHSWDRRSCLSALKRESFCLRLLTVLRASRVYGTPWQKLERLIPLPLGQGAKEKLRDIHKNPDGNTVAESIPDEAELSVEAEDAKKLPELESTLWDQVMEAANRQFYAALGDTGTLVAYCYLKTDERKKLVSLSEMLRRGTSVEERLQTLRPLTYRRGGS